MKRSRLFLFYINSAGSCHLCCYLSGCLDGKEETKDERLSLLSVVHFAVNTLSLFMFPVFAEMGRWKGQMESLSFFYRQRHKRPRISLSPSCAPSATTFAGCFWSACRRTKSELVSPPVGQRAVNADTSFLWSCPLLPATLDDHLRVRPGWFRLSNFSLARACRLE